MWAVDLDGLESGVVGMAGESSLAMLVAEQHAASGAELSPQHHADTRNSRSGPERTAPSSSHPGQVARTLAPAIRDWFAVARAPPDVAGRATRTSSSELI
jgi:hypothetical protein